MKDHKKWIEAYQTTKKEYANRTHHASKSTCAKCLLVTRRQKNEIGSGTYPVTHCEECPENVFRDGMEYGCIERECKADSVTKGTHQYRINRLVAYHNHAINFLKEYPVCSLTQFRGRLLRYDKMSKEDNPSEL